jgi:hypothetical protein
MPVGCKRDDAVSAMREAEEHARALVPRLWHFHCRGDFADDPQMLLGSAILMDQFAPHPKYSLRSADLYRAVLEIEPGNRVAMAALARHTVTRFVGDLGRPLMSLEMKRQYAELNNLKEVVIPSHSDLYEWFGEEGKDVVTISDFDAARARIVREQLPKVPAVRAVLGEGMRMDPNNALYDYLGAQLDFELGHDEQALVRIRKGAEKAKLDNYVGQLAAARRMLLERRGTAQKHIDTIDSSKSLGGLYVDTDKILRVAEERATAGDTEAAAGMYELLIRVTDQAAEENDRANVGGRRTHARVLEYVRRKAREGLAALEGAERR